MYLIVLWRSWLLGLNKKQCRTKSYDMTKVKTHFEKVSSWLNCLCALGSRGTNATFFYTCYWISIEAELTRFFLKCVNIKVGAVLPCVVMVTGSYVSCPVFEMSLHYNGLLSQGPRWLPELWKKCIPFCYVELNSWSFELFRMWLVEQLSSDPVCILIIICCYWYVNLNDLSFTIHKPSA